MAFRSLLLSGFALLVVPVPAPAAGGETGGAAAPSTGGGATYGQPATPQLRPAPQPAAPPRAAPRVRARPVASSFAVSPSALSAGAPATFSYRVDAQVPRVRVRITLTSVEARGPVKRLRLGYQTTGVPHTFVWTPAPGELAAGDYSVMLQAFDDAGRALRRTARASGRGRLTVSVAPPPAPVAAGRFPVQGPYSFGSDSSRFGAARDGHVHQGQDISAAEGTPVVAPLAGVVTWVAFQAKGAGHYIVLRGEDGRDYVFMHLKDGSLTVAKGALLAAGQQFAQVGSTGGSSGPHLHFEIWPSGWYSSQASAPVDPLPQLQAWAAAR
jgi:murein DD-endopeptidase MepM/ murein hydrolase activator NlpD